MANIWRITQSYIFLTSDFLPLGEAPAKTGDTIAFKEKLQTQLKAFREKHKVLFPLLQPINITVVFISPKFNVPDLDNLARSTIPFITEIFKPPLVPSFLKQVPTGDTVFKSEVNFIKKLLPYSITGYQTIQIPRQKDDPENGRIDFIITDGLFIKSNVWNMVDDLIDKWN